MGMSSLPANFFLAAAKSAITHWTENSRFLKIYIPSVIDVNKKVRTSSGTADLSQHAARYSTNGASVAQRLRCGKDIHPTQYASRWWPIGPILGFRGSKVPQNGRFLLRTPLNHRAKFDAANFIRAGEIRNRTNKQNKQTVNDISTLWLCLSACVDNKRIGKREVN